MLTETNFAPKLSPYLMDEMPIRMSQMLDMCVWAHGPRDDELVTHYETLMRITQPNPARPWRGSCNLTDPITFEHFLSLFATLRQARSQKPWWLVDAENVEDEGVAPNVQIGLSMRASRDGFDAALYDADWVGLRDKCAPMFIGWTQKRKNVRSLRYRAAEDPDPDNLITEEEMEPGVDYETVPYLEPGIEREGLQFEVCDLANFYMWPPDAKDVDSAIGVGDRVFYTAHDLLRGIQEWGFDEDIVNKLIDLGPTGYTDKDGKYQEIKADVAGTQGGGQSNEPEGVGYYVVYRWFGKLPLWQDQGGSIAIPKHLRNDEFCFYICPHHRQVLRFSYSEYAMRPYALFKPLREPGGQGGESVPSITGAHQDEATAWLRLSIDSENIRINPMFKVLEENDREFGHIKAGPGRAVLCKKSLNEVEPFQWDMSSAEVGPLVLADVRGRAREVISGAGYGQLQNKVRKSAEIEAAVAGVSAKMGLFVDNMQNSGMQRAALLILSHLSKFGGNDAQKLYSRDTGMVEISPEDWKKSYSIVPRASADDANPIVRVQKKQAVLEAVRSSPIYQMAIQAGDTRYEWHALGALLQASDERNIPALIGNEPPPPEYIQIAAQVMAQVYEATTGMPVDPGVFMQSPPMMAVLGALAGEIQSREQEQAGSAGSMVSMGSMDDFAGNGGDGNAGGNIGPDGTTGPPGSQALVGTLATGPMGGGYGQLPAQAPLQGQPGMMPVRNGVG